jgi:hypothetical protein
LSAKSHQSFSLAGFDTFCYWKSVIAQRDAEEARSNKGRRVQTAKELQPDVPPVPQPLFTRFAIADLSSEEPGAPSRQSGQSRVTPSLAAEVVDANNGRRLRIFNGADQATVTALISALACSPPAAMGFDSPSGQAGVRRLQNSLHPAESAHPLNRDTD